MNKFLSFIAVGLLSAGTLHAQTAEDKISIKPSGRILMDAALMDAKHNNEELNDGVAIPDMRVGVKATYGPWTAKVDMGYAYGAVSMKDVFIERSLTKNSFIRGGYFIHQFGLQSATSSSFKISMEEPASNEAFNNSRTIGLMYVHGTKKFLGTFSAFTESDAMKMKSEKLGNQGVGLMSRLVYRPFIEEGKIFHVGISGAIESPRYNKDANLNHHSFTLGANLPTRVAKVSAIGATINNARKMVKFTPELTAAYGKLGIETQYFYVNVDREGDMPNYTASGAYCSLRGLLKGKDYHYNYWDGGIDTPRPGAMEVVLAYNYTDMSDAKSDIRGGRLNDWSAAFNYYINKYMIWRVRASHTKVTNRIGFEDNKVSMLETRLQIKF
ncbi:MAG: porin [Prevotella sp.]|nr:porin [Prevotella sp.]